MRAVICLFALVASASAFCEGPSWRDYVFAKGQARVTRRGQNDVLKNLRVVMEKYSPPWQTDEPPTVLATATTDDTGFYVIAGSQFYFCGPGNYRLRLYDDDIATYSLNKTEIPRSFVTRDDQPVKVFESNIAADYFPPPS